MKIALIGASGFTGSALLRELTARGNDVIAIARNSDAITISSDHISAKSIDVLDTAGLAAAISGADLVVSAFNAGWSNPDIYNDFLNAYVSIQQAVKDAGVPRYIVIGGAGSLSVDGHQLVDSPDFPAHIKPGALAARDYLTRLRDEQELDWAFFSPAIEMHPGVSSGRTGQYRLGTTTPVFNEAGQSQLSVEDLAVVIADELENNIYHRQQFTAAY